MYYTYHLLVKGFCVTVIPLKAMSKKRPEQQASRTYASGKDRYKNQDKHRWRRVGACVLPVTLSISVAFVFTSHGRVFIWALVASVVMFLGFALILLEWYIWKADPARQQVRTVFFSLSAAVCFVGLLWPLRPPSIVKNDPGRTEAPRSSPSPASSAISRTNLSEREFLDVDPEKLLDFFESYNEAQAEDLVKPYIGKWMETSGVVVWVRNERITEGATTVEQVINGVVVGFKSRTAKKRSPEGVIQSQFDEQRWIDRARVLRPFKDTVKVRGQIRYIFSYGFYLKHCEIIE